MKHILPDEFKEIDRNKLVCLFSIINYFVYFITNIKGSANSITTNKPFFE